jgi:tetratricopeptide (TPR) repeat protein
MRPTRLFTATLLVVAFSAIACSKRGELPDAKAGSSPGAPVVPVATKGEPLPDDEGFVPAVAPTIAGPATFADGETAYHAGRYGDAAASFESYIERRPGNAWGHYMLGLSAWKSGDLARSEAAFEKALSIDPRHAKSLVNLSRVLIDQQRHDDAIERLTRAAEIEPEAGDVYRLLGRAHHSRHQIHEAEEAYQRAIELNDRDAWSMNNLGLLFLETKRADEALPLLARAVELKKGVPEFQNNLGMALEHTGRFRAAAEAYSAALAADPGYAKAKQNLARVEAVKAGPEERFTVDTAATR